MCTNTGVAALREPTRVSTQDGQPKLWRDNCIGKSWKTQDMPRGVVKTTVAPIAAGGQAVNPLRRRYLRPVCVRLQYSLPNS